MEIDIATDIMSYITENKDLDLYSVDIDEKIRLNIINWVFEHGIPKIKYYLSNSISIVDKYNPKKEPIEYKLNYFIKSVKDHRGNDIPNSCDLLCNVNILTNKDPIKIVKRYSITQEDRYCDVKVIPVFMKDVDGESTYANYFLQNKDRSVTKLVRIVN